EELMAQVQALQHKLDNENTTITFELLHFLKNWLVQHINESDKRFGAHFQKVGLGEYSTWTKEVEKTMKKKKWWWKFW
ncbi:MAG TPA: hemerythrin, partial [Nitrospira sp.]|nr:hemerythrin [Nitrospira sp.]